MKRSTLAAAALISLAAGLVGGLEPNRAPKAVEFNVPAPVSMPKAPKPTESSLAVTPVPAQRGSRLKKRPGGYFANSAQMRAALKGRLERHG